MSIKVLPLVGYKSTVAFKAFNALVYTLNMLPSHIMETFEEFSHRVSEEPDHKQETLIRKAIAFQKLEQEEVEALISFVADKNGVPYGPAQLKSMPLQLINEICVAVAMEISKIKISVLSEYEKKKYLGSQSMSEISS